MTKLNYSTYYHIKLYQPWNLEYDIYVIGTINKENISEIEEFDIRSTYFTDYNLGLSTYLNTIKNDTPIYICHPIKNKSPIEININERIFIPESLIDFNQSFNYLVGSIPKYNITINPKFFKNLISEINFSKYSMNVISKTLNTVEPFVADTISIEYDSTSILIVQQILDEYERDTKEKLEYIKLANVQSKINDETRLNELYLKKNEYETAKTFYDNKVNEYNNLIGELSVAQREVQLENDVLVGVKNVMITIIDQIKTGQISVNDFPSFYEIYENVKNNM